MNAIALLLFTAWSSLLIIVGSRLVERALTEARWPVRWIWLAATGLTALLPLAAFLGGLPGFRRLRAGGAASSAAVPTGTAGSVGEAGGAPGDGALSILYGWWDGTGRVIETGTELAPSLTISVASIGGLWAASSAAAALILVLASLRLRRDARHWPLGEARGRPAIISPSAGPATLGLLNPRILLPRWALRLPDDELDLILAHEAEHVRSRDTLVLGLGLIAAVACPWNPAVWLAMRRLKWAVEVDCDARVLGRGASAGRYGRVLLDVGSRGRLNMLAIPEMAATISQLERRLRIMKQRQGKISLARIVGSGSMGALLLVAACSAEAPAPTESGATPSRAASQPATAGVEDRVVVRIDADGIVRLNDRVHAVDELGDVLDAYRRDGMITVIEAHQSAPYGVVAAVQEELRRAELLRVLFVAVGANGATVIPSSPSERDSGLGVVLPDTTFRAFPTSESALRNVLFLEIFGEGRLPAGSVIVRQGNNAEEQLITTRQVEGVVTQLLGANPSLIVVLRTHPDATYGDMFETLDGIQSAGATRFSLQTLEEIGV